MELVADHRRRLGPLVAAIRDFIERGDGVWDLNLPSAPERFFDMATASFQLEPDEAVWLAERIAQSSNDSLIAWLAGGSQPLDPSCSFPWLDPAVLAAPAPIGRSVMAPNRGCRWHRGARSPC